MQFSQACLCNAHVMQYLQGLWVAILLTAVLWSMQATAQCATATYTACPTALQAAQVLTANNPNLPISNAAFTSTATCSGNNVPYLWITDFGSCHYLASSMSTGKHSCTSAHAVHTPALASQYTRPKLTRESMMCRRRACFE